MGKEKTLNAVKKASLALLCAGALAMFGCETFEPIFSMDNGIDTKNRPTIPTSFESDTNKVMSKAYWDLWNKDVQKEIDARIEKFRKADGVVKVDAAPNTDVEIKQIKHSFIFGAHIFNFNQLGKKEYNDIYKSLYGTLFNSATVAFYWKCFEFSPDQFRFATEYWDTEDFWNNVKEPKLMPHWRRPSSDQVVEFCQQKHIRIHGHPLVWGSRSWHMPEEWLVNDFANPVEKALLKKYGIKVEGSDAKYAHSALYKKPIAELEKLIGHYAAEIGKRYEARVKAIAEHYGDIVDSWDVVNESATDFEKGNLPSGNVFSKSWYGIMQPNYDFDAFRLAQKYLPAKAKLNINDYNMRAAYINQIKSLEKRGCKIDIVGSQMHLFNPEQTLGIANGKAIQTPKQVKETMDRLATAGKPIHLSEITITAAGTGEKERMMQAIALRNLYRMWFSIENMMGITWWNVVDDCGAPGEPSMSGLFTRDMKPKPAFFAMNDLINGEWKTNTVRRADADGNVKFRGFKGLYEISYTDKNGDKKTIQYNLK